MISQYLYISTAPNLTREDVESIVETSRHNNLAEGITGLLLYNGRNFLQLLEGEESKLVTVMMRISHDPRHTGISLIERRLIEERSCPDWAMQRITIAQDVSARREALDAALPSQMDTQLRKIIMNFAILN